MRVVKEPFTVHLGTETIRSLISCTSCAWPESTQYKEWLGIRNGCTCQLLCWRRTSFYYDFWVIPKRRLSRVTVRADLLKLRPCGAPKIAAPLYAVARTGIELRPGPKWRIFSLKSFKRFKIATEPVAPKNVFSVTIAAQWALCCAETVENSQWSHMLSNAFLFVCFTVIASLVLNNFQLVTKLVECSHTYCSCYFKLKSKSVCADKISLCS